MPIQIEDDPIHWLIGVKCRKITHGYCTLQIENGIAQIQITRDIMYNKTTRTAKGPRNSNSNQTHNMSLCTSRHFYACTDRRTVCATVHHSFISAAEFYIYVALSTYLPFYAQQQEVKKKCNIHRPTPFAHRFILINSLDLFVGALCVCACINN